MEIVSITELQKGDIILIEGMNDLEFRIVEIESITDDYEIIPKGMAGVEYIPKDLEHIIRLGIGTEVTLANGKPVILYVLSQKNNCGKD